jgi:uncharacterized membrane protein required for colicin V production
MISFPMNTVLIINITISLIIVATLLFGYYKGFIKQFFDLVILILGLIIAWPTSLALSKIIPILSRNLVAFDDVLFGQFSYEISNIFIWFVIILILVGIALHQIAKPIINQVKHVQWMRQVDKILGVFIALIPQLIWILIFMIITISPLIANGKSTLESSILNPLVPVAQYLSDTLVKQADPYGVIIKVTQSEEFTEEDKENISLWLKDIGIPEDKLVIVEKFVNKEEFNEADLSVIQEYLDENEITETQARLFLERFGLTQSEIDTSISEFTFK